jgi:hypothetical protein
VTTKKISDVESAAWSGVVDQVKRNAADARITAEELIDFAGNALDRHARRLLADLLAESANLHEPAWDAAIRRRFADGLERAGIALREALADSRHRHSVSQVLQRKMFEAESMIRKALKARIADVRTPVTEATV